MSFDNAPEAKLNTYGGLLVENTAGIIATEDADSMIRRRLYEQLATQLAADAVTITKTRYTREHRLQVYVLTPAQLEKYVQRRAEQLNYRAPNARWVDFEPTH